MAFKDRFGNIGKNHWLRLLPMGSMALCAVVFVVPNWPDIVQQYKRDNQRFSAKTQKPQIMQKLNMITGGGCNIVVKEGRSSSSSGPVAFRRSGSPSKTVSDPSTTALGDCFQKAYSYMRTEPERNYISFNLAGSSETTTPGQGYCTRNNNRQPICSIRTFSTNYEITP